MSAPVVWIRGGKCGRRKNRAEDAKTIQHRRMIATCETQAHVSGDGTARVMSDAVTNRLPCNNLRLLAGTLDVRTDFKVRLAELDIARAEREAYEAKWLRAYHLYGGSECSGSRAAADAVFPDRELHFDRWRQATMDLARTPALTKLDLKAKRRAIGSIWLKAEGSWYDQLRAAVAEDAERLERTRAKVR